MRNDETNQELDFNQPEQKKKSYWSYLWILLILLIFGIFSISYSVYLGEQDDNQLNTGEELFTYSDSISKGTGILLENAFPLADRVGRTLVGEGKVFDFSINATTKDSKIYYKVLINKEETSTLDNDNVRIYLTKLMGSYEQDLIITDFSSLKMETINGKDYYVLYEEEIESNEKNHTDSYRLRMWLKENASNYQNKTFSIKVDIYGYQIIK